MLRPALMVWSCITEQDDTTDKESLTEETAQEL